MDFIYLKNAVEITKKIMCLTVKEGSVVVDCTVGNGKDTLHLAKLVGDSGRVYGFDIQQAAIDITKNSLEKESLLDRVILINDGHEKIDKYIDEELDFIIYNWVLQG